MNCGPTALEGSNRALEPGRRRLLPGEMPPWAGGGPVNANWLCTSAMMIASQCVGSEPPEQRMLSLELRLDGEFELVITITPLPFAHRIPADQLLGIIGMVKLLNVCRTPMRVGYGSTIAQDLIIWSGMR